MSTRLFKIYFFIGLVLIVAIGLGIGCGRTLITSPNAIQAPTTAYSGALFSPQPSFTYPSSNTSSDSFSDELTIGAYIDSACSTAATGTFTVTTNPLIIKNSFSGSFAGVSYTDAAHLEGTIYLRVEGTDSGRSLCTSAISIPQHFNVGFGYVVSGTTGAAGATAGSERDSIVSSLIDSNGRYVALGSSKNSSGGTQVALWRYYPDGTLDTTFGVSGVGLSSATGAAGATLGSESDIPYNLQTDSSGRYMVVGSSKNTSAGLEMALWRFTSSGVLDTSFGSGVGSIVFGTTGAAGATLGSELDVGTSLVIDSSGNFIIAGSSANTSNGIEATLWRYTSAGVLDTTFATVGYVSYGTTGAAGATAGSEDDVPSSLQTDSTGNFIMAGISKNTSNGVEAAVWRFTSVGVLDTTFASGAGVAVFGTTGAAGASGASELDSVNDFKFDLSGNYVLVGSSKNAGGGIELAVWRYTSIGVLDTTFNTTGSLVSGTTGAAGALAGNEKDRGNSLAVDSSGRFVIGGYSANTANGKEMSFWRVTTTGSLDTTLNTTGHIVFGTTGAAGAAAASENDSANKILTDSNGRFVISGSSYNAAGGQEAALWRYLSAGTLEL